LLTSVPTVGWGAEIGANVSKSDESLWKIFAEFAVIDILMSFWQIAGKVGWASNLNTQVT
jgi:hypothetical protein